MVKDIKPYIEAYLSLEPNMITFHIEAAKDMNEAKSLLQFIKENHTKAGIAINPKTKLEAISELLPYVHHVLVMSVEPGLGGQKLIPETLDKVRTLKQYQKEHDLEFDIEIDGGVNKDTIKQVKEAGVDIVVAGSYIVNAPDLEEAIKTILK